MAWPVRGHSDPVGSTTAKTPPPPRKKCARFQKPSEPISSCARNVAGLARGQPRTAHRGDQL
jgi:hypothetical protein